MQTDGSWNFSEEFHLSSHGRGEYGNHLPPGPLHPHLRPSHMSYAPFIPGDPIVAPGAVSTVDYPQPFYFGPPFTALGSHPIGYPSPTFQDVSTQTTLFPIVPGPPSGTSIPPASFCAPPSRRLGRSPASFINSPSGHRLDMSSASHARLDIQPVSVSRVHHERYVQPYAVQSHRRGRTSNRPLNMYPAKQTIVFCPLCPKHFTRDQDRYRHLLSHLPYWIGCSCDGCSWRGYRLDAFRKHWYSEHRSISPMPDEDGSKLYNPNPLIKQIVQNPDSIGDAQTRAVSWVKTKAAALCKQELLADPWGNKRSSKDPLQYSQLSETSALPTTPPAPFSLLPPTQPLWVSAPVVPKDPHMEAKYGPLFLPHYVTGSPLVHS